MYTFLRSIYRRLDRLLLSRLPTGSQLSLKSTALRVARRIYPGRVGATSAAQLLSVPAAEESGASWREPKLPAWVLQEMEALSAIDPDLHPRGEMMRSDTFYSAPWTYDKPGVVYAELWRELCGRKFDCVILVPWLKTGGADLGAIHVANALADTFHARVLVITTEPTASPWAGRLSPRVKFIEAGKKLAGIAEVHQVDVMVRLLLQLAPSVLHVMNSKLGWEAIARNGLALRQATRLYASLYCDDTSELGLPVGYARTYLPRAYQCLDAVVTDNSQSPKLWAKEIGIPESLFHVLPFPGPVFATNVATTPGKALLWAGRLDRQKRPDLLLAIAKALPEYRFDVYGSSVIDKSGAHGLARAPNVVMHGPYDRFADLVKADHLAFVYTTAWDGMPNILLEAAAAGLPVVAPDVGGISDFLAAGDLLPAHAGIDDYVADIRVLAGTGSIRAGRVERQRNALARDRTLGMFLENLDKLAAYRACRKAAGDSTECAGRVSPRTSNSRL